MTTLSELASLVDRDPETFIGITAAYEVLLGGVPTINGYAYLLDTAEQTGIGEFNQENTFINLANALVDGNDQAAGAFQTLKGFSGSLVDEIEALYVALVPKGAQTTQGLAYLTRPEALAFYETTADERGVVDPALVAFGSIINVLLVSDMWLGDDLGDLRSAVGDGTAQLPETGGLTDLWVADGVNYDVEDLEFGQPPHPPAAAIDFI